MPSLLLAVETGADLKPFVAAYGEKSAGAARQGLHSSWLLLGDWGPTVVEAAALGKKQFAAYGKSGVVAHNEGRYPQALALFENALAIASENTDLAKNRATLHRYARESAFATGDMKSHFPCFILPQADRQRETIHS